MQTEKEWKRIKTVSQQAKEIIDSLTEDKGSALCYLFKNISKDNGIVVIEDLLLQFTQEVQLWIFYYHFSNESAEEKSKIVSRALKFCPDEIQLYKFQILLYEKLNWPTRRKLYIDILDQALRQQYSNTRNYTDIWQFYCLHIYRSKGREFAPFEEAEAWLKNYLSPEEMHIKLLRAKVMESSEDFRNLVREYGTSYYCWAEYIKFLEGRQDQGAVRKAYRRAVQQIKDYSQEICQQYLDWEQQHGKINQIISAQDKVYSKLHSSYQPPKRPLVTQHSTQNQVFIQNLPPTYTETDLQQLLETVVKVKSLRIVKDKKGQSRCFAYADLRSQEQVEQCIRYFNNYEIGGQNITVEQSKTHEEKAQFLNRHRDRFMVFVNNLPFNCDVEDLRKVMIEFGNPTDIRLVRSPEGQCKGYGFVDFDTEDPVKAAIAAKNRILDGRRITFVPANNEAKKPTLMISNLDYSITEEQLKALFNDVTSVQIPKTAEGQSKGIAFLEFAQQKAANTVLRTENIVINDRPVTIRRPNRQPRKQMTNKDFGKFL